MDLLAIRVESLKARALAQSQSDSAASLDAATLAKATELADRIEERLQIAETAEGLNDSGLDHLIESSDLTDVRQEFDRQFGGDAEKQLAVK